MSNPKDINKTHPNKNPDEVDFTPSAEKLRSQEKIDLDESEFGREQSQQPADEHISEDVFSQIDSESAKTQQKSEINEDDIRDQGYSSTDWDAENSRTGRHK